LLNPAVFDKGPIYPNEVHRISPEDVLRNFLKEDNWKNVFRPKTSNLNTLAFDCLAKTLNQALRGPFF